MFVVVVLIKLVTQTTIRDCQGEERKEREIGKWWSKFISVVTLSTGIEEYSTPPLRFEPANTELDSRSSYLFGYSGG